MPSRYYQRNFQKGYFYHIYNRGANKNTIFTDNKDYETFIQILAYYLTFPTGRPFSMFDHLETTAKIKVRNLDSNNIALCAFCLMPNHFHLLIKQVFDDKEINSISNLMRRLTITYAMYFTNKYKHSGVIFQGKFKNILVDSDTQLLYLSKYIHRNSFENQGSEPIAKYKYSSYPIYLDPTKAPEWLNVKEILSLFSRNLQNNDYKKFTEEKFATELPALVTLE